MVVIAARRASKVKRVLFRRRELLPCSTTNQRSFACLHCTGLMRWDGGCTNRGRGQDKYSRCLMNIVSADAGGAQRGLWRDGLPSTLTSRRAPQMQHLYEPTALRGGVLTILCQQGCAPGLLCRRCISNQSGACCWMLGAAVSGGFDEADVAVYRQQFIRRLRAC